LKRIASGLILTLLLVGMLTIASHQQVVGDLNTDGKVDIQDVAIAANAFGSSPSHPRWNPIADLNNDSIVNILDVVLIAKNFGE